MLVLATFDHCFRHPLSFLGRFKLFVQTDRGKVESIYCVALNQLVAEAELYQIFFSPCSDVQWFVESE